MTSFNELDLQSEPIDGKRMNAYRLARLQAEIDAAGVALEARGFELVQAYPILARAVSSPATWWR